MSQGIPLPRTGGDLHAFARALGLKLPELSRRAGFAASWANNRVTPNAQVHPLTPKAAQQMAAVLAKHEDRDARPRRDCAGSKCSVSLWDEPVVYVTPKGNLCRACWEKSEPDPRATPRRPTRWQTQA